MSRLLAAAVVIVGTIAVAAPLSAAAATMEDRPVGRVEDEGPVTASDREEGAGNNSPQIVAHPDDENVLALANRLDAPDFSCALHVSGDGGESWAPVEPVPELPGGAEACYGPEVAFGPDGTLYYMFVGLAGGGNQPMGVFLTSSDDRGQSFSDPIRLLGELRFGVRMAVDADRGSEGRLHFVWVDGRPEVGTGAFGPPPNPLMSAYSDDGGQTLSEPVRVSDEGRERVVGPALEVDQDGGVHVAYYDLLDDHRDYQGLEGPVWDGQWELVAATSEDGGDSFGSGVVVDEVTPHERVMVVLTATPPALAVGDNGLRCVAWTDARHGDGDVLASCSPPEAADWSEAVRVNDNPPDSGTTQDMPKLAVSPSGRVDAVFYDRRGDDEHDLRAHVAFAYSSDHGQRFSENVQVTSHASDTWIGQQYDIPSAEEMVEFGDRLGLLSGDDTATAAWTDTRNIDGPSRAQDVFAARMVDLPEGPGNSDAAWWGGGIAVGGLGIFGLVALVLRRRRVHGADIDTTAPL